MVFEILDLNTENFKSSSKILKHLEVFEILDLETEKFKGI